MRHFNAALDFSAVTCIMIFYRMRKLLILASPDAPGLATCLKGLEIDPRIGILGPSLSPPPAHLEAAEAVLLAGYGKTSPDRNTVQAAWPHLSNVKWIHTLYTGLEQLSFSEAAQSDVIVTNSKGVYSSSLAEYALAACSWFAKDLPRLQRAKAERKWDPYEVEELRGKTMGVVGYGDIGQACARLAHAFKMHVVGLRRRAELSEEEKQEGLVDAMYTPNQLTELMSQSDYVVMSTPLTPQTEKLVNAAAIAAMKPNAIFINIGRGKCVDEEALIKALKSRRIRGAGLDVFATEPLPTESELWRLDNVLISPHCADRTAEFQEEAMELFLTNVKRWLSHQPLQNVVDKAASIQLCC